jgi:hypothetical protein
MSQNSQYNDPLNLSLAEIDRVSLNKSITSSLSQRSWSSSSKEREAARLERVRKGPKAEGKEKIVRDLIIKKF